MSVYDFTLKTLQNATLDMKSLQGKVILIVNTASKCGFATQLSGFEQLHQKYKDQGLQILGFPSNQFNQEVAEGEIESFCQRNHGVTFPMMKETKLNGPSESPLYAYLKKSKPGLLGMTRIKWNYEKFLVDKSGKVRERFSSITTPEAIASSVEKLLAE